MKLLFKQKFFSWLDSYDIFNENGEVVFRVKGELSFGHKLIIYDNNNNEIGIVKEKILTWFPKFEMYSDDTYIGCISKEFTFLRPKFNIDYNGWCIEGDWFEWDYVINDSLGNQVASITKEVWNWTDTYSIDVNDPNDVLYVLMLVIAIDAEKCSRSY